ncbi:MAG: hypothetical protein J0M25_13900, partial [Flavobacteriales bacterium]|nr:hypothetical protein [Flavobacteriales bacterium]
VPRQRRDRGAQGEGGWWRQPARRDGGKEVVDSLKPDWWFGISPEGFGTVAMIANFVVALVVNKFTPEPPHDVQEIVENIRIPSGAGEAVDH